MLQGGWMGAVAAPGVGDPPLCRDCKCGVTCRSHFCANSWVVYLWRLIHPWEFLVVWALEVFQNRHSAVGEKGHFWAITCLLCLWVPRLITSCFWNALKILTLSTALIAAHYDLPDPDRIAMEMDGRADLLRRLQPLWKASGHGSALRITRFKDKTYLKLAIE